MKKLSLNNLSLLVKLFSILALFIIVPVAILIAITNFSILHYAENEIGRSGIGNLKVAQSLTELLAGQISKETLRLSLNPDLNELYRVPKYQTLLTNINQLSVVSRSLSSLSEMVKTNSFYQSVYVYLDHADYLLASSANESEAVIRKEDYRDNGWFKSYQSYQKRRTPLSWLKTRISKYNHIYIPENMRKQANDSLFNYVITYIHPLTPYTTKLQGAIVVNLYEDALCKLINSNPSKKDGYIFIMNLQGDVFSHVDKQLVGKNIRNRPFVQEILQQKSTAGRLITKLNEKRCLVTYLKTELNDWIYVGVFPMDTMMAMANSLSQRTVFISLILVIVGVAFSQVVSRKIVSPVQQVLNLIRNRNEASDTSGGNELTLISHAFDEILNKEDQLMDALEKNKRNMLEHSLLELLRGESGPSSIGAEFSGPYYLCILIVIDQYREFIQDYSPAQHSALKRELLKTAETAFGSCFNCAGMVLERGQMVIIINCDDNPVAEGSQLEELCRQIQETMVESCSNPVSMGIGGCHADLNEIKLSFHEAQMALQQKITAGYGQIHFWHPTGAENPKYFYPLALEKHLLNHLELGQPEQAKQTLAQLIAVIEAQKDLSYDNLIQIFNQLLGNTIKFLLESHLKISDIFDDNSNLYQELAVQETLPEIHLWFEHLYTRIFEFQQQGDSNGKNHLARILDYIHQNYRQDIDINTLADHVGLSYSHVRKIFHDNLGENIVNYINNLRIGEAKRLLRQTKLSINEVALSLGYNNSQSFNRFFKKYEGITPGEFRSKKELENIG